MKYLALIFLSAVSAAALPVKVGWNRNPAAEGVTKYLIYKVAGTTRTLLKAHPASTTPGTDEVVQLEVTPGDVLVVVAFNGRESEASDSLTIPALVTKPQGFRVVEIQTSANQKDWKTIALVPLHDEDAPARFIRAGLASIDKP